MLNDFFDTFVVDTWWAEKLYCGSLGFSQWARSRSGPLGGLLGGHVFNIDQFQNLEVTFLDVFSLGT